MSKTRKWINRLFCVTGFITILLLVITGLYIFINPLGFLVRFVEAERYTSPDGKVDAVLMHYDAGATTSLMESIYIVPKGKKITKRNERWQNYSLVFMADHIKAKKIHWLRNKVLEIQYEEADIHSFKNIIWPLTGNYKYVVEIRETPLAPPPSISERYR